MNLNIVKKDNFFLSGFIAFSIYIFCFLLFALYVNAPKVKQFDAFKKNTVLELDVMILDAKKTNQRNKNIEKESKKSHEIVKKSTSRTAKQNNNVKSLFSKVKTKSTIIKKDVVNNVQRSVVSSRFKSKFEKQQKSSKASVSKILDNVKTKATVQPSTDASNNHDPYYSKIYELLSSRWNPMLIIDGLYAKVIVIISSDGTFDYRILRLSGNERFDDSLKAFLNEQKNEPYPVHSRGSKQRIEVKFTSKEG